MVIPSILSLFMSPLTPTSNDPNPVDPNAPLTPPAATEVEWYRNMLASGLLTYSHDRATGVSPVPKMPGYPLPEGKAFTVPDVGTYWSIKTAIERQVFALVGTVAGNKWTPALVLSLLNNAAVDAASNLRGTDPDAANIPGLVAKYAAAYWTAVTPV